MMDEKWFSAEEIAEYLSIKKETVYKWIASRNMPAHKIGRTWRFNMREITLWVNSMDGKDGEDENTEKEKHRGKMTVWCNPSLDTRLNITWNRYT